MEYRKRIIFTILFLLFASISFAKDMNVIEIMKMRAQDIRSQSVQSWLSTTGRFPIIHNYDSGYQYYNYYSEGVTVLFVKGKLNVVFVYAEGIEDHRQFNGQMPYGLKMSMTKKEIEKILGNPEDLTENGVMNYTKKYVGIQYDDSGPDARPNSIQFY